MNQPTKKESASNSFNLIQFLGILFIYRRFLLVQFLITSILSLLLAFIVPLTFTSTAAIVSPSQFNGLGSILPMGMTKGLSGIIGSSFDQGGETSTVISILNSRSLSESTIREFDLMDRFGTKTIEDALITFNNHKNILLDEEKTIIFSVNFTTELFPTSDDKILVSKLVYDVANYMIEELDKTYTGLGTQKAKYEREVVERRYIQNQEELFQAEENLKRFSEQSGIIEIETQAKEAITAIAALESRINIERVKLSLTEKFLTNENSSVIEQRFLVDELERQLINYTTNNDTTSFKSIFPSFEDTPSLGMTYIRLLREVEVQTIIYEFLTQQYEQLKIQETKDTPSIQYIDTPRIPTKKSAPKRSLLIIGIVITCSILSTIYILIKELYRENLSTIANEIKNYQKN